MKVVVVGAGIAGASVAYHLGKRGGEVVIVDGAHEGQATAAGAGIVCPWLSSVESEAWHALANRAVAYYPELVRDLKAAGEEELGYEMVGAMRVSEDPAVLDQVEAIVRKRSEVSPEVGEISRLSPDEARQLFPLLREDLAAVHVTGGARVDGRLLRDAMLCVAVSSGVEHVVGEAELIVESGRVVGVSVQDSEAGDSREIRADAVVVAAGAWAERILAPHGVKLGVEPQKGQIMHVRLDGVDTSRWPVVLPESSHYLLAFDDSRVVVGATRETDAGFDYRVTAGGVSEVLEEALAVAPGLEQGDVAEIRVGFRPVGEKVEPIVGGVSELEGLTVVNGLGASGLTLGPYVGRLAAELVLGVESY